MSKQLTRELLATIGALSRKASAAEERAAFWREAARVAVVRAERGEADAIPLLKAALTADDAERGEG